MVEDNVEGAGGVAARRGAPLPVLGRVVEPVYRAVMARRNAKFDAGRGVTRLEVPVISVGNLSVGGTGKTPLVMHVLRVLLEAGRRPCVAMRGYTKSADGAADEADAYRRAFAGVPVVAQADRLAGLRELFAKSKKQDTMRSMVVPGPTHVVLDDGFQHRQIARDLDVVLIDATPGRSVFEDRCLPAGWLREPVTSLKRAGAVVLTHAELADAGHVAEVRRMIAGVTGAPVAVTRHVWTGLKQGVDGERMLPLDVLIGKRVVGCCAIGHPGAFERSLRTTVGSAGSVEMMVLPDHDPFAAGTVERLRGLVGSARAEYVVVTDKDWSKLRRVPGKEWSCPVVRPDLAMGFDAGREEFDRMVVEAGGDLKLGPGRTDVSGRPHRLPGETPGEPVAR